MKISKIHFFSIFIMLGILAIPLRVAASQNNLMLDFGWSNPAYAGADIIQWSYKISNNNHKPVCAPIEIVMVTDDGMQYEDSESIMQFRKISLPKRISTVSGDVYPGGTKIGKAIFRPVNNIKQLNFFVSGLIVTSGKSCNKENIIFKLTYEKKNKNWKLTQTEWLK